MSDGSSDLTFREAAPEDAPAVFGLVRDGGVLELNTQYAYVLLCDHFRATTVVCEHEGEPVGVVAAYRPPTHPDAVFVWQIGVSATMRGRGVARSILNALVERPGCDGVCYLEATVTPSNEASRRLFESFARHRDAAFEWAPYYDQSHLGDHEPEELIRIGPFERR